MPATGTPPLRVLVVDDARDPLMLLGIVLRSEGMLVRLVEKAAEVDEAVADFKPDVVLLDIEMPERSGLEIALGLQQRLGERCPPLIAVTAHDTEAARRLTAKSGFRHHVAKPYDFDAMVHLVVEAGAR